MALSYRTPLLLFVLVLLAGCGVAPEVPGPEAEARGQVRTAALAALNHWELDGRIAIQREQEGWFASLHWLQQGASYQFKVSGPAGQGGVRLSGDERGVTLTRSDGTVYHALLPEELLASHFGWQVPVTGLYYWIRGLPVPSSDESHQRDAEGRLVVLRQDGWKIQFDRYQALGGLELPGRVTLERPSLSVRVIADRWLEAVSEH